MLQFKNIFYARKKTIKILCAQNDYANYYTVKPNLCQVKSEYLHPITLITINKSAIYSCFSSSLMVLTILEIATVLRIIENNQIASLTNEKMSPTFIKVAEELPFCIP